MNKTVQRFGLLLSMAACSVILSGMESRAAEYLALTSSASYNIGDANDHSYGVAVDKDGNYIIVGNRVTPASELFTIKTDKYLNVISSVACGQAYGQIQSTYCAVAVDSNNNIIVAGTVDNGPNKNDFLTVKYNSDMVFVSSKSFNSDSSRQDTARGVAVDSAGNIIVVGEWDNSTAKRYLTVKYNNSLTHYSSATYNGGGKDRPWAVAVDSAGNIIVTGQRTNGTSEDFFTVKYDASLQVVASTVSNITQHDIARGVAVDGAGNIIVTGYIYNENKSNQDYLTIKYDPTLNFISSATFNGGEDDFGEGVAVDGENNIIVTGQRITGANKDYFTIKYDNNLVVISSAAYDGETDGHPYAVAVDSSNKIIVTGESDGNIVAVKYSSETLVVPEIVTQTSGLVSKDTEATFTLKLLSGNITVTVPPGGFSRNVVMTVKVSDVPEGDKPTVIPGKIAIEISNDKDIQPLKPITITIRYRPEDVAGLDVSQLVICRYTEIKGVYDITTLWTPLPSVVDAGNRVVTATTDHLSTFVLAALAPAADLGSIKAYPNPLNSRLHSLTIEGLTGEADIKIYNVAGELVRTVEYTTANGQASWDGKNDSGSTVASGVYIVYIKSDAGTKKIKIAVEK